MLHQAQPGHGPFLLQPLEDSRSIPTARSGSWARRDSRTFLHPETCRERGTETKKLLGMSKTCSGTTRDLDGRGSTTVTLYPAQPPAVPGAPAAALPRTESRADSLRPLSCPKPAKLFKRLNTVKGLELPPHTSGGPAPPGKEQGDTRWAAGAARVGGERPLCSLPRLHGARDVHQPCTLLSSTPLSLSIPSSRSHLAHVLPGRCLGSTQVWERPWHAAPMPWPAQPPGSRATLSPLLIPAKN